VLRVRNRVRIQGFPLCGVRLVMAGPQRKRRRRRVGADGVPAPTTEIVSFPGSEHCEWQRSTFLSLGEGRDQGTLWPTSQRDVVDFLQGEYVADMRLPDDAVATLHRPANPAGVRLRMTQAWDR
jgi:hypothetical protein